MVTSRLMAIPSGTFLVLLSVVENCLKVSLNRGEEQKQFTNSCRERGQKRGFPDSWCEAKKNQSEPVENVSMGDVLTFESRVTYGDPLGPNRSTDVYRLADGSFADAAPKLAIFHHNPIISP